MMTFRLFLFIALLLLLTAFSVSFLWVQCALPGADHIDPWDAPIHILPTVFTIWLPAIYLFFTAILSYLAQRLPNVREQRFLTYDLSSYGAIFLFFLLQIVNKDLASPVIALNVLLLIILGFKCLLLFRTLYVYPEMIRPRLLLAVSFGIYTVSFPFLHIRPDMPLADLFQSPSLLHVGILSAKSAGLSLMMLEMFRLSLDMTKSLRSAFLSWLIVSFTFPVLNFPKLSLILTSLLLIFVLRLIITRLDTRELITGLLEPASLTIVLKFFVVLLIIGAGGLVFWSNVRPGFEFHGHRAYETAIGTLLNGQSGLFSYAPVYWLSLFGLIYFLFFRVWNGIVLIVVGSLVYAGYHFINYGILEKTTGQYDSFPFLPFLGIFLAVAHHRFGRFLLFQLWTRFLLLLTCTMTAMLFMLFPNLPSIFGKFSEIQHALMQVTALDFSDIFPSMIFRVFSASTFFWIGGVSIFALICCYLRTRSFSLSSMRLNGITQDHQFRHEFLGFPMLLLMALLSGAGIVALSHPLSSPLLDGKSLQLSTDATQYTFEVDAHSQLSTKPWKGLLVVSNLENSVTVPHKTPLMSITIFGKKEHNFETFTIKAWKDTAEKNLDLSYIAKSNEHGRASIYHSHPLKTDDGTLFEVHDYYTRFLFSKPVYVKKITLRLLTAKDLNVPPGIQIKIKEIFLLE